MVDRVPERQIADILNSEEASNRPGHPWSYDTVRDVLTNEKYIGNNVTNRTSRKLQTKVISNPADMWVRSDGVFTPIVGADLFQKARLIRKERQQSHTDENMLEALRDLLRKRGSLSRKIIDNAGGSVRCGGTYAVRFGGLLKAYERIGYKPSRAFNFVAFWPRLIRMTAEISPTIIAAIERAGAAVVAIEGGHLQISGALTAKIVVLPHRYRRSGATRWAFNPTKAPRTDVTIAVRLTTCNERILDYFALPRT